MPERPQAWSRPMSARWCPASTMDTTIGQPSGHRLPGRIRPDTVTSSQHAMATRKQCGQRTNEWHRSPSDILDRHHHNGGPPYTPSLSCGPGVCGLPTKVGSAMATLPARPQPRQLLVSLHRSSRASGALLSSDDFGSSVERTATLHPLWQASLRSVGLAGVRRPSRRDWREGRLAAEAGWRSELGLVLPVRQQFTTSDGQDGRPRLDSPWSCARRLLEAIAPGTFDPRAPLLRAVGHSSRSVWRG
jgi:hypothetical protein